MRGPDRHPRTRRRNPATPHAVRNADLRAIRLRLIAKMRRLTEL